MDPFIRKTVIFIAAVLLSGALSAAEKLQLKLAVDHPDGVYKAGETVQLSADLTGPGKTGREKLKIVMAFQNSTRKETVIPADGTKFPLVLNGGTVRFSVTALDADGKPVLIGLGKKQVPLNAQIGVIADPEKIRPGFEEPKDFQEFWDKALADLAKVPLKASRKEITVTDDLLPRISTCFSYRSGAQTPPPKSLKGKFRCWDVKVDCVGGVPVSGYLTMPADAKPKSLPAIVTFQGAGVKTANKAFVPGTIRFDVNAHGIENGQPAKYYQRLAKTTLFRYVAKEAENRDKYYFRNMYLRVKRALDYVKSLPEYDGKTLIVVGNSQGGGQTLVAGGLDPDVILIQASVPAMCDHGGGLAGRVPGWPRLLPVKNGKATNRVMARTLPYFDAVFFARRIKAEAYLSVGLVDVTCSPTSVFAAFNAIPGKKHITILPRNGHQNSVSAAFVKRLEKILPRTEKE